MMPSSLLFWSALSSSKKVSLKVTCPECLGPATWLSKHSSALQGVLRATGQTGTEGAFAATCNSQLFPTPRQRCPLSRVTRRAGFTLAVPSLHCSYALPLLGRLCRDWDCLGHCWLRASAGAAHLENPVSPLLTLLS